jgi:hypothetical protein
MKIDLVSGLVADFDDQLNGYVIHFWRAKVKGQLLKDCYEVVDTVKKVTRTNVTLGLDILKGRGFVFESQEDLTKYLLDNSKEIKYLFGEKLKTRKSIGQYSDIILDCETGNLYGGYFTNDDWQTNITEHCRNKVKNGIGTLLCPDRTIKTFNWVNNSIEIDENHYKLDDLLKGVSVTDAVKAVDNWSATHDLDEVTGVQKLLEYLPKSFVTELQESYPSKYIAYYALTCMKY